MKRVLPLICCAVLLPSAAQAGHKGSVVKASLPWVQHPGDALDDSLLEQRWGVDPADVAVVEPRWQGDMLFTHDSYSAYTLGEQGLPPLPAMSYDAAPGILFLAMEGVTLNPTCNNSDSANSARNCSPLVDQVTNFPAYGNDGQRAALLAEVRQLYAEFNIIVTSTRPPEWIPYTMAVVGGTSQQAGQPGGVCGVANVSCDGLKRNHVSLTFPQSCGGVADVVAQETSHNWGLEHTNNQNDLMYPFNTGGFKTFVNSCMAINNETGNGQTQCGYIHEVYCAAGGGEQQNSFGELLGVFGPNAVDTVAPAIVEMFPPQDMTITTADSVELSARVDENSNFLAARWVLTGAEEPLSRCTNSVCDMDYNTAPGFEPNEIAWDFVSLTQPPAGRYTATFEVADAYGGYDVQSVTITVIEPPPGGSSGGSDTMDTSAETETPGGSSDGAGASMGSDAGTGVVTTAVSGAPAGMDGSDEGCACSQGTQTPVVGLGMMLALFGLRRRRAA